MEKQDCEIKIYKENDMPGFGAWLAGSGEDGNPTILLNVHATFQAFDGEEEATKEALLQVLMHEFGHAMEEYLNLNFDEERVQSIAESYSVNNVEYADPEKEDAHK